MFGRRSLDRSTLPLRSFWPNNGLLPTEGRPQQDKATQNKPPSTMQPTYTSNSSHPIFCMELQRPHLGQILLLKNPSCTTVWSSTDHYNIGMSLHHLQPRDYKTQISTHCATSMILWVLIAIPVHLLAARMSMKESLQCLLLIHLHQRCDPLFARLVFAPWVW